MLYDRSKGGVFYRSGEDVTKLKMPPTQVKDSKHISQLDQELDVSVKEISVTPSSGYVLFKKTDYTTSISRGNKQIWPCY